MTELADAEGIYAELIKEFPSFLPAHVSLIQKLDVVETKNSLPFMFNATLEKMSVADAKTLDATLKRVVTLANIVISGTNAESLLAYYGLKSDSRPDAVKIKA